MKLEWSWSHVLTSVSSGGVQRDGPDLQTGLILRWERGRRASGDGRCEPPTLRQCAARSCSRCLRACSRPPRRQAPRIRRSRESRCRGNIMIISRCCGVLVSWLPAPDKLCLLATARPLLDMWYLTHHRMKANLLSSLSAPFTAKYVCVLYQ